MSPHIAEPHLNLCRILLPWLMHMVCPLDSHLPQATCLCPLVERPHSLHAATRTLASGCRAQERVRRWASWLAGGRTDRRTDGRTDGRTGPRTDGRTGGLLTLAWLISDLHLNTTTIAYPRMNTKQRHGENSPLSYSTCCWVLQANACCCCSYPATVRCWCSNKM